MCCVVFNINHQTHQTHQTMQTNLHSFFKITRIHNENHKRCFIYEPATHKAFFTSVPIDETDTFISIKTGVKLYYRQTQQNQEQPYIPIMQTNASIPLLKSNLQKAVRRGCHSIAVSSALAMIQKEPMQFLRRLPIIYIEDVCLIDSFPIVIWLLMADAQYTMNNSDIMILIQIVYSLCDCSRYDDCRELMCKRDYTHETLENEEECNHLLSLHYRYLYGGLKGDMQMLKNAIEFYIANPPAIIRYSFSSTLPFEIDTNVVIMREAIDFHPFPAILTVLHKMTGLDKQTIKECIWFAESGYNSRKQYTIETAEKYKEKREYIAIAIHLNEVRDSCLT